MRLKMARGQVGRRQPVAWCIQPIFPPNVDSEAAAVEKGTASSDGQSINLRRTRCLNPPTNAIVTHKTTQKPHGALQTDQRQQDKYLTAPYTPERKHTLSCSESKLRVLLHLELNIRSFVVNVEVKLK
jgi:hypothetical protein